MWYESNNCDSIVISSRVRLARNLEKYPFAPKLDSVERGKMLLDVKSAFMNCADKEYKYVDISSKSQYERLSMVEEHLISKELALLPESVERMLIYNEDASIMVGEEDHVRIQVILPGFDMDKAYSVASSVDTMLGKGLKLAFSEKLGYLTCCPSNTGTGMRASVMLHLPMLTRNNYMKSISEFCSRSGLVIRGFYGEGTLTDGELYQISNQLTLGISEEDTIKRLKEAVSAIVDKERELRDNLKSAEESGCDNLWRSYGVLRYARRITSNELMSLWSDILFAKDIGLIKELNDKNLFSLLIRCMPNHLILSSEDNVNDRIRDEARAKLVRDYLSQ